MGSRVRVSKQGVTNNIQHFSMKVLFIILSPMNRLLVQASPFWLYVRSHWTIVFVYWPRMWSVFCWIALSWYVCKMCLKTYTEAKARRAGSHLVTGCTGGCHFDTVRCGQGGRGLSLWWPYGLRFPDLVYILSFLFIMNITEMIGISLRIVLRCFHDLMFCCVEK